MKKMLVSLLSLLVIVTLGGCQSKFDPQSALKESRETLSNFLSSHEDKEQLSKTYDKEALETFFTDENKDYFTENFKENILSVKLDKLEFDSNADTREIGKQLLFLSVSNEENGLFWNKVEIDDEKVDKEKEAVTYYLRSKAHSLPSRYVEMVKEKGEWKINNILDI